LQSLTLNSTTTRKPVDGEERIQYLVITADKAKMATFSANTTTLPTMMEEQVEKEEAEELFVILYRSMLYLLALYIAGDLICGKFLKVIPPLVGQIGMGMLLGPQGLAWVPSTTNWPLLGELGLVLLLCQAGLEMDFDVLKQVGPRGAFMALVGSLLPTSIGFGLAYWVLGVSVESALAVGCSFGPTSAGIALNVLQPCGVLKTALGQLIVAIAIVDDIIALVVLSQLQALTAETVSASAIAVPIVSALLWLFVGGAVALYVMPKLLTQLTRMEEKLWLDNNHHKTRDNNTPPTTVSSDDGEGEETLSKAESTSFLNTLTLSHITILLFALLPATYYSKASHLLGAFLAGLSACQQSNAAEKYNQELDRIIKWLLRIFFGASIAFVIPVELFQDATVIGRGFLLALALLGKLMTGLLLTPVQLEVSGSSSHSRRRFDRRHVRDCLVVGFSMAGEAEFAMLVAGFGFGEGLLEEDIYASTVFAILLSTILSPCLLRLTLALFVVTEDNISEASQEDAKDDEVLMVKDEEALEQTG
jgi:Kef-type K+ transport system membrane component KefB